MQHRSACRITLIDEQCGLDTTDLIEMSGLFPVTLIKRQVLILDDSLGPARGGGECSQQTNLTPATTFNTVDSLITLRFVLQTPILSFPLHNFLLLASQKAAAKTC